MEERKCYDRRDYPTILGCANKRAREQNYANSPKWEWSIYYQVVPNNRQKETLLKALSLFEEDSSPGSGKMAIDLGCGHGPDTLELLKRGWTVTAIDSQKEGLDIIKNKALPEWSERLHPQQSEFEGLKLHKAHLVNASLSLPFADRNILTAHGMKSLIPLMTGGDLPGICLV